VPAIKRSVAVVGSAGGELSAEARGLCRELGREIARRGCTIVTGACPGLPQEAVFGAKELGGLSVGISPALCLDEHRYRYHSPYEEYDVLIFTGSGLMGREVDVIRSSDVVVVAGGRSGTLGEFSIAYDDGNVIAALLGTGGIADHLEGIVSLIRKDTGTEMIYSGDPVALLDQALACHDRRVAEGRAYAINEYAAEARG
jgi:uncharacterized protein (TIGR00725 family)